MITLQMSSESKPKSEDCPVDIYQKSANGDGWEPCGEWKPPVSTNTDLIHATALAAAQWWADRLEQGDKTLFVERLSELVRGDLEARGHCNLHCDYDPQDYLLDAVRFAGVDCGGHFFSARGVLPAKHTTRIEVGLIEPKEGYGNWTEPIVVTPNQNLMNW